MGSFKLRLVAYFALLALLPLIAVFWGFSALAGQADTRQLDAGMAAQLRLADTLYRQQLAMTETSARRLARRSTVQRLLERRDLPALARVLVGMPYLAISLSHGGRVGASAPAHSGRRTVSVVTVRGVVGTVIAYRPIDRAFATSLRSRSGLAPADVVAFLRSGRIVVASTPLAGRVDLAAGTPASVTLGGIGYRAVGSAPFHDYAGEQLVLLSPLAAAVSLDNSSRRRLLLVMLSMLVVVVGAAYVEGRAIVATLRRLVKAVDGFAGGRLGERVPARGRDEFARLGRAFNEMAEQLESRLEDLRGARARLGSAVDRIGTTLAATHDPEQLIRVTLETMREATGARSATFVSERGTVHAGESRDSDEQLVFPVRAGETEFGTLTLFGSGFSDDQRHTAQSLATQSGVALENARLHSLIEQQAHLDGLTGIANRRRSEQALASELARAKRFGTPFSIVLTDLDDFKVINDRHGHAVGDAVLRDFAAVLRDTIRDIDFAGRWGGEEFLLLLPGTDNTGAIELAERIRAHVQTHAQPTSDGAALTITASFGVASYPAADTTDELFAAADEALYRAKARGKNTVEA